MAIVRQSDMTQRILRVYRKASPETVAQGVHWYDEARRLARRLAHTYGLTLRQAAATIAAVSPQKSWAENTRLAEALCAAHACGTRAREVGGTFGYLLDLAQEALDGDLVRFESQDDKLPKVRAFYRNIVGDSSYVTLDRWAFRAAGVPENTKGPTRKTVLDSYKRAAALAGMSPADMQAIVWCAVRGKHD